MSARARIVVIAVSSLLAVLPFAASAVPMGLADAPQFGRSQSPADIKMQEGVTALAQNDLEAATVAFSAAAKLDPKKPGPLLGMAEVAQRRKQNEVAEGWLKKALAVAPKSADVQRAWGRYKSTSGDHAAAVEAFRKAIELDPKSAQAHVDLGDAYLNGLRKPKEATEAYRAAIKLQSTLGSAQLGLGRALAAQGDTAGAIAALEEAARQSPDSPVPLQALARLYAAKKQFDKAIGVLDSALKAQPNFAPALLDRGDIHTLAGQPDKALGDYKAAVAAAPKLPLAHFKLGVAYQNAQQPLEAEKAYRAAIDADPKFSVAYNNLAWLVAESKERQQDALNWAKKAVELAPKEPTMYDTLGWVYRARGELDLAIPNLERAAASTPPRADFHYHLGLAYADKARTKDAIAAFKKALEISKDFPEAAAARKQLEKLGAK